MKLDGLSVEGGHKLEATWYDAIDPKVLSRALSSLQVDYARYVFVDLGSGKGRAVFIASGYPFRRVIGVEFAKELHNAALKNSNSWRGRKKCGSVEFVFGDALDFEFPSDPCVLHLYNPFGEGMLRRVLQKLQHSIDTQPRDVIIVYSNPRHDKVLLSVPNVQAISKSPYHVAYRLKPSFLSY